MSWLVVVGGIVLLVFLHELGHFTVALAVGLRPRSFYIGFPPAIAKIRRRGIEYGIGAIPLGGLVRIPGMHRPAGHDLETFMAPVLREQAGLAPSVRAVRRALDSEDFDAAHAAYPELERAIDEADLSSGARRSARRAMRELEEGTGSDAYWRAPTWKRVAVIAAGPLTNVLLAFVILFGVYMTGGPTKHPSSEVAAVEAGTPAAAAGLQPGDRVLAVDGHRTTTFDAVSRRIRASHGRAVTLTVERDGSRLTLGPRRTIFQQGHWIWGFEPAARLVPYPVGDAAHTAVSDLWGIVRGTGQTIGSLFQGRAQGHLQSTVGIVRTSHAELQVGFAWYLVVLGFVSMSLALLNLLPLLPLDGGHILFSLIEGVRRRALAREVYERFSVVGIALIVLVFFIALSNDVSGGAPH
ncbi:MAG TPA: site-2 protease family protein [Gaiellaceae bacterium]|jgi:regulator of sigma E protease|nr:site-2 protease family protein [Gaiellaceae bacterium]